MNLVEIFDGINTADYRWVCNIVSDSKGKLERFKSRLVVKVSYEFFLSHI